MNQRTLFRVPRDRRQALSHGPADTTRRSYDWLRKKKLRVAVCERTDVIPVAGQPGRYHFLRCRDLFGFMDLLYFDPPLIVAVQACQAHEVEAHLAKFRASKEAVAAIREWLSLPNCRLVIHSWQCYDVRNKKGRVVRWKVTEREVLAQDLEEARF